MPPKTSRTCDNCRKRKIKCVEDDAQGSPDGQRRPCVGCRNLAIECTHDYVKKKPGRKNAFALALKQQQAAQAAAQNGHGHGENGFAHDPRSGPVRSSFGRTSYGPYDRYAEEYEQSVHGTPPSQYASVPGGTPRSPYSAAPNPGALRGDIGGLSWLDSMIDGSLFPDFGGLEMLGPGTTQFGNEQAQLLSLESPENLAGSGAGSSTSANGAGHRPVRARSPQVEDVTSWANISHYISLYLAYLWPLLPLVHRPTFAEKLVSRADLRDTDFRALLLSIVAFTISQLPTTRLVTEQFDVEGLKRLQRKCHRTSQALQRGYTGQVTLTQICIIIFDNFYLLSIGLQHTAAARLGQAVQLAFCLGLHSDARTEALNLDPVEIQLRRRVFWQLYASDKTRAIPGNPMLISDFQGVCSYPEAVDDDFITSQGMFPQPSSKTSLLVGFVAVSKLFRVMSECFFHHRCLQSNLKTINSQWPQLAEERIHKLLNELPLSIQDPNTATSNRAIFATQRANILITTAIVKFALYDLRSALAEEERGAQDESEAQETRDRERQVIAREIYNLLISIPVEDLASNGESVRSKVIHIACALVNQNTSDDNTLIKDWCDMFSAISFVQMPVPPLPVDSRSNTPPPPPAPAEPPVTA